MTVNFLKVNQKKVNLRKSIEHTKPLLSLKMNKFLFLIGLFSLSISAGAQVFVTLPVSFDSPVGYHDDYNTANQNFGNAAFIASFQIPGYHFGVNTNRGLMAFDLSSIPVGSTIISAKLNLHAYTDFTVAALQNGHCGNNQSKFSRITSNWNETTVTWNSQPAVSNVNEILLNQSNATNQDYLNVNVSNLVQDMVNNPTTSFGFRLALVDEVVTSSLAFCSKEYPDPSKHPSLVVEYRLPASSLPENIQEFFRFEPNPVQHSLNVHFSDVSNGRKVLCIDAKGKIICSVDADYQDVTIDMSSITSGIYFISVNDSNRMYHTELFLKN